MPKKSDKVCYNCIFWQSNHSRVYGCRHNEWWKSSDGFVSKFMNKPDLVAETRGGLTPQQYRAIELLCTGIPHWKIAQEMGCTLGSARSYIYRAMDTMGARNNAEAAMIFIKQIKQA